MNCIQPQALFSAPFHPEDHGRGSWFWGCVVLSVTLHLIVVLAVTGWKTRSPAPEKPDQAGVPVEFVIDAIPSAAAGLSSSQALPSAARQSQNHPEETLPSKPAPETRPAPENHRVAQRTGVNPQAGARGEATPAPRGNPRPEYPDFARRKGWQGECLLRVVVSPEGRADAVSVHRSSGYAILDQSAAAAVRRWKFLPRVVGEQRLVSTIEVPVNFSLLDR